MTTGGVGRSAGSGQKRWRCSARAGARSRWDVAVVHRATRSWTARASKQRRRARSVACTGARRSKAARVTSPSTARARFWPCISARRTRPTAQKLVPSWCRLASGILPLRVSPRTPPTSVKLNTSPAKFSEWNCGSSASPRSPSPAAAGFKRGRLQTHRFPLAGRTHLRVAWPVPSALQRVRKNGRQRRGVALVRDDAFAPAPTRLINSTAFNHTALTNCEKHPQFVGWSANSLPRHSCSLSSLKI